jgi:protein phosphatase
MEAHGDEPATPRVSSAPEDVDTRPLVVKAAGLTDRGRVRERNEDQFLIAEPTRALRVLGSSLPQQPQTLFAHEHATLLVVADGMGGHRGGQEASRLVVATVEELVLDTFRSVVRLEDGAIAAELRRAVHAANLRMFQESSQHPELRGMGTTVTLAYVVRSSAFIVHVGDSRLYLYRRDRLHQLTRDHTLVAELVEAGVLEPEQVADYPLRSVLTNAVGGNEPALDVEVHRLALEAGDVVLLCSDGLTGMIPDEAIARILSEERDPRAACAGLIHSANTAGGTDNITAVVARFDSEPRAH